MAALVANSNDNGVSTDSQDSHGTQEFSSPQFTQSVWGLLFPTMVGDRGVLELKEHEITIGRGEKCTISLSVPQMSSHHCTIKFNEAAGAITIKDTSTNGTWINNKKLSKETKMIGDGDEIVFVPASKKKGRAKVSYFFKKPDKENVIQDEATESFVDKYLIVKSLGKGAFAEVKLVRRRYYDGENKDYTEYAMKEINKEQWSRIEQATDRQISLLDEVKIMQTVGEHENIVSVIEYFEATDRIYVIMDFCDGGDMLDYIQKNGPYSNEHARNLFKQLTNAINYMHNSDGLSIAHRDLKPDNILLCGKNSEKLKISDFGISRKSTKSMNCKTIIGTPLYQAPEVQLKRKKYHEGYDGKLSDIWSMGVILYIMLVAAPPSGDPEEIVEMAEKNSLLWYDEPVVETAKDLIYKMLKVEPKNRLTAKQVLQHAWMLGWDTFEEYKSGVKKAKSDKDKDKQNGEKKDDSNGDNNNSNNSNNGNNFDFDKDKDKGLDEDDDDDDGGNDQDDTKDGSNGSENSNGNKYRQLSSASNYSSNSYCNGYDVSSSDNTNLQSEKMSLASNTNTTTIQKLSQQLKSSQLSDEVESNSVSPNHNDSEDEEDDDLFFYKLANSNPKPNKSLKRKCRSPVASSCYTDDQKFENEDVDMSNSNNNNNSNKNNNENINNGNDNNHNKQNNNNNNKNNNNNCDDIVIDAPPKKRQKLIAASYMQ